MKGLYTLNEIDERLTNSGICYSRSRGGEDLWSEKYDPDGLTFRLYICDGGNGCIDSIFFEAIPAVDDKYHLMYEDEYRLLSGIIHEFRISQSYFYTPYCEEDDDLPFK